MTHDYTPLMILRPDAVLAAVVNGLSAVKEIQDSRLSRKGHAQCFFWDKEDILFEGLKS